ncbi:glutathione S-transferase C-terminal domain-containing protein [Phenylobacterium sp.]|uniref:glutathione S-transferase N-terminal domain-containing protein n=1 Tax=Phenylobacterium sp. TaxID=1871053 RepID=UPI001207238B|nr:glutathione S-transferase C-terminal domain-containing protein [Phenylobacterium sp.]THD58301.1 MAG: glutathione S-transferase [Phenylobacterium sp.]
MNLYFSPLACSMASRIVLYEAGGDADFVRVDTKAGRTTDGDDYAKINPKGLVPALRTDDGEVLTENAAILQYLGERFPQSGLVPTGFNRALMQQWLSFVGTELHAGVFHPLFVPTAGPDAKGFAREHAARNLAYLDSHLDGRDWLLDRFTVADAYLTAVLNWAQFVNLDLAPYPHVAAFLERAKARPSVAKAMGEEAALARPA